MAQTLKLRKKEEVNEEQGEIELLNEEINKFE